MKKFLLSLFLSLSIGSIAGYAQDYELVTDASQIAPGGEYIVVATASNGLNNYAMANYTSATPFGITNIELNEDGTITLDENADVAKIYFEAADDASKNAGFPYYLSYKTDSGKMYINVNKLSTSASLFSYKTPVASSSGQTDNMVSQVKVNVDEDGLTTITFNKLLNGNEYFLFCHLGEKYLRFYNTGALGNSTNRLTKLYKRMGPGAIKATINEEALTAPLRTGTEVVFSSERAGGLNVNGQTVSNPYTYTITFDGNATTADVKVEAIPAADYPKAEGEEIANANFTFNRFEASAPEAIVATANDETLTANATEPTDLSNGTIVTFFSENAGGLIVDGETVSNPYDYSVSYADGVKNYSITVKAIADVDYLGNAEMPEAKYTFGKTPALPCGDVVFDPAVDAIAKGVEISLSCENAVTIMYSIDGGISYIEYTEPFTLDLTLNNNNITVWAYGINGDGEGSKEKANKWEYSYKAFPLSGAVTFTADGETLSGSTVEVYPGDKLELTCDENAVKIMYSINGQDAIEYTEPITLDATINAISAYGLNEDNVAGTTTTFNFDYKEFTSYELVTSLDEIQSGAKYVIVAENGLALATYTRTGFPGTEDKFVQAENFVNVKDGSDVYVLTIEKTDEGKFKLYNDSKTAWISASDAGSFTEINDGDPSEFDLSFDGNIAKLAYGSRQIVYDPTPNNQRFRGLLSTLGNARLSLYRLILEPEAITATIDETAIEGYTASVLTETVITFASEGADYLMLNGEKVSNPYEYTVVFEGDDETPKTLDITAYSHKQITTATYTINRTKAAECEEILFSTDNEVRVVDGKNLIDFGTLITLSCENAVRIMYSINYQGVAEYTEPIRFDAEETDVEWTITAYGINLDGKAGEESTMTYYRGNAKACKTVVFNPDGGDLVKGSVITLSCDNAVTIKYQINNEPEEGYDYDFENGIIFDAESIGASITITAWGINADDKSGEKTSVEYTRSHAPLIKSEVAISPNGGAFYAKDLNKIELSINDENAVNIMYQIGSSEAEVYNSETGIEITDFTEDFTITAWAVNVDENPGPTTTATFNLEKPLMYKLVKNTTAITDKGTYILVTTLGVGFGDVQPATTGFEVSEDMTSVSLYELDEFDIRPFKITKNGEAYTISGFGEDSESYLAVGSDGKTLAAKAYPTDFYISFNDAYACITAGEDFQLMYNPSYASNKFRLFPSVSSSNSSYQQVYLYRLVDEESLDIPEKLYIHGCFYDGEWERSIQMERNGNVFTAKDVRIATNGRGHQYILATFPYGDIEEPFGSTDENDGPNNVRRKANVMTTAVPAKVWDSTIAGSKSQATATDKIYVPQADGTATTYTVGDLTSDSQIKPADALQRNARHDITADFSGFSPVFAVAKSGITTGVEDIEFDENAPIEYFNLQGIRVDNPDNGYYIRRQGTKTEKVYIFR